MMNSKEYKRLVVDNAKNQTDEKKLVKLFEATRGKEHSAYYSPLEYCTQHLELCFGTGKGRVAGMR